jgi:hypothetical protein
MDDGPRETPAGRRCTTRTSRQVIPMSGTKSRVQQHAVPMHDMPESLSADSRVVNSLTDSPLLPWPNLATVDHYVMLVGNAINLNGSE